MYQIELVGGTTSTCDTYTAAIAGVLLEYPDAVTSHDGDLDDGGDRTLCWANAHDAANDDGANAIAVITRSDMSREEVLEVIDSGDGDALCTACDWLARQTGEDCDGEYSEESIREAVAHVDTAWLRPAGE
jgi:hypothetical protein